MSHSKYYLLAKVIHTQSVRSRHVYVYTHSSEYREAGRAKEINKLGQKWMPRVKESFQPAILGTRIIGSVALNYSINNTSLYALKHEVEQQ